jgi:hypothetical protein
MTMFSIAWTIKNITIPISEVMKIAENISGVRIWALVAECMHPSLIRTDPFGHYSANYEKVMATCW